MNLIVNNNQYFDDLLIDGYIPIIIRIKDNNDMEIIHDFNVFI